MVILLCIVSLLIPLIPKKFSAKMAMTSYQPERSNSSYIESINFIEKYIDRIPWINDSSLPIKLIGKDWSQCQICKYPKMKKNVSNSNPEDLVLGLIFGGFPNNLLTLARSIRSSGSNATVVILACEGIISEFDEEYIQSLNNCGINLVPIPNFYHRVQKIHGNLLRHAFFSIFLKKYAKFFNRAVVLDVYDTYFQLDPFTPDFPKSKVYFSYEALKFKNNDVNNAWVKLLDSSYTYEKYMNLYPLCSGLFFGYIGNLVKFYDIFVNITH